MQPKLNGDILFVLLSLFVQVPLAVFLGHFYDDRIFMATGYLVSSGVNPYLPYNFVNVFPPAIISGNIPTIGYPALWPAWLGLAYKISYGVTNNVFLYNSVTKIPLIAADVALAFLVRHVLRDMRISEKNAQLAFLFILFNPFILLTTVAWGEFDTLVIVLCLASFHLLTESRITECALCFGFAVALKPIVLPLAPLPLFYAAPNATTKKKLLYISVFLSTLSVCYFGPFLIAGWRIPLAPSQLQDQVQMAGGMTLFSVVEFFQSQSTLPTTIAFLGYLWIPALIIAYYAVYRACPGNFSGLIKNAVLVLLFFFLSRTWVSEPNLNLFVPLMLLAASFNAVKFRDFHLSWILPLVFMFPNYAFPQLFFLINPSVMTSLQLFNMQYGTLRVVAQLLVVVVWQVFALKIVAQMLQHRGTSVLTLRISEETKLQ